ncbi:glycosyl hydrolase family 18 [Isoptericola sp. b490]|uniref:carbohydrate-binding protein n=1 Tax=Actinotalea lenta TaxID=3064654 RepID=UPI0027124A5B|nr:carbohydrate-binding protein [Isoptericola sp. b490]MDO8121272.1 glycosyl hydrolase family 18 [Isoptericola sp. b490]
MSRRTSRTRLSLVRVLALVLAVAGMGWVGARAVGGLVAQAAVPGRSVFDAYVDVTATPSFAFETPEGPAQSSVVLSFVVADPGAPCTPSWGGYYTLDEAGSTLELDRRIAQLRSTGGEVSVSFGGQAGTSLASACTDAGRLHAAYQAVVDRYRPASLDLDVEGAALSDAAGVARRAAAVKAVQDAASSAGAPLPVWLTLPVGRDGLTSEGVHAVRAMLSAGVDLAGVNGMTMDFGVATSASAPLSDTVRTAATALQRQVGSAWDGAGRRLSAAQAWNRVGVTVMIGQSDVPTERFTIADANAVATFASTQGVGRVSMWSLNRDATCAPPLPTVLTVVQTSCSGVDQRGQSFARALSAGLDTLPASDATATAAPTPDPSPSPDDPATSPYPIWDPYGTYPGGTKVVWHHKVYQARYWTSGVAPDTPTATAWDSPWTLLGPVMPGDTPAPLPTLPTGTYPQWDPATAYVAGDRVQVGDVPYQAKWWSKGQEPGVPVKGGSPWLLVYPQQ